MSTQEKTVTKPTWQEVEKAIIDILRAGIYCRKPKDKGFMKWYKKQLDELRGSEEPEMYIYEIALDKFPNEEVYKQTMEEFKSHYKKELRVRKAIENYYNICFKLAKESFNTEEEIDEELNEFINS